MNINLEVEPKFHKGQTIWVIDHGYWNDEHVARWNAFKCTVKDVTISIGKGYYDIAYRISEERSEGEEWCFATEEEAKEDCRRRNGKDNSRI